MVIREAQETDRQRRRERERYQSRKRKNFCGHRHSMAPSPAGRHTQTHAREKKERKRRKIDPLDTEGDEDFPSSLFAHCSRSPSSRHLSRTSFPSFFLSFFFFLSQDPPLKLTRREKKKKTRRTCLGISSFPRLLCVSFREALSSSLGFANPWVPRRQREREGKKRRSFTFALSRPLSFQVVKQILRHLNREGAEERKQDVEREERGQKEDGRGVAQQRRQERAKETLQEERPNDERKRQMPRKHERPRVYRQLGQGKRKRRK